MNVDVARHEMTFCFATKSGAQYTVRWRDNGEGKRSNPDELTLATGCAFPLAAILWGVDGADIANGNIQTGMASMRPT